MSSSKKISIGKLVRIVGGGTPSTKVSEYFDGDIPWVTPKDMKQWEINDSIDHISLDAVKNSAAKMIPPNAVLVVLRSGVLKHTLPVAINTRPVTLNQDMKALICGDDVHPAYLARFLKAQEQVLLGKIRGTTADNLPLDSLKSLEIPLPSIAQQRRIAAILDRADAVRRKRQEAIALTEELLRSAFLEMFGDPVTNSKGWEIVSIESVASSTKNALAIGPFGSSLKVDDYREIGHPVIFVRDVRENQFSWISKVFVNNKKFQELQSHHVRPGDIVATKMGLPPCIAAVYPTSMPVGIVTADIIKVTLDHKKMIPTYAAAAINSDFCKGQVARFTEGITRPKVTLRDFKNLLLPCPPLDCQENWEKFVFQQQIASTRLKSDLDNLNNLFNSLLQRAFRGEL